MARRGRGTGRGHDRGDPVAVAFPDHAIVAEELGRHGVEVHAMKRSLVELGDRVAELPALLREEDAPAEVVNVLAPRITRVADSLKGAR